MNNKITERYFESIDFAEREEEVLQNIFAETGFKPEKEVYRGKIYDEDKLITVIYVGKWENNSAILKIHGIKPSIDEIEIIEAFNEQNQSNNIRLPKVLKNSKWDDSNGYSYLLLELDEGNPIYSEPFASDEEIQNFCSFYEEYRTKALKAPLFPHSEIEKNALEFTQARVLNWVKIAESQGNFTQTEKEYLDRYLEIINKQLPSIQMKFMHSLLHTNNIREVSDEKYILRQNLYWGYKPEYYDATIHIWAAIKSIRDISITSEQVIDYIQKWVEAYKNLPSIQKDDNFQRKFNLMMLERCIGTLLVDIENDYFDLEREQHVLHLKNLFKEIFDFYASKL